MTAWAMMLANALRVHVSQWHDIEDETRDRWAISLSCLPDTPENIGRVLRWAMKDMSLMPVGYGHKLRAVPTKKLYMEIKDRST